MKKYRFLVLLQNIPDPCHHLSLQNQDQTEKWNTGQQLSNPFFPALKEFKSDCLSLRVMNSFPLYNPKDRTLLATRDSIGIFTADV